MVYDLIILSLQMILTGRTKFILGKEIFIFERSGCNMQIRLPNPEKNISLQT